MLTDTHTPPPHTGLHVCVCMQSYRPSTEVGDADGAEVVIGGRI